MLSAILSGEVSNLPKKNKTAPARGQLTIGLPRALLYARYGTLWLTFFEKLGIQTLVSEPTTLETLNRGSDRAIDEMCLAVKIYLGHVDSLVGKCDYILVPRISNFGVRRAMCTTFEGMYDICCNVYRRSGQKFLAYNVDVDLGHDEMTAFFAMAGEIGVPVNEALVAYRAAKKAEARAWKARLEEQEALAKCPGLKVLVAAHSYVAEDEYIGKPITDFLHGAGVTALRADIVDRKAALKQSEKFSPTMRWELSREIAGGICQYGERVDGIILLSVFPCGPDAMTSDIYIRRLKGVPILNLVLDAQSGMAGVETRLESFVDILRFKHGEL